MSAYIVNPETIALIAVYHSVFAEYQFPKNNDVKTVIKHANVLLRANIKSIAARYPDTAGKEIQSFFTVLNAKTYQVELLEKITEITAAYVNNNGSINNILESVQSSVSEYIYQSCEYTAFYSSRAYIIALEASHEAGRKLSRGRASWL